MTYRETAARILKRAGRAGAAPCYEPLVKELAGVEDPAPAWGQLMTYARTKLEMGEVGDILEGLAQAGQEHPELRQQYEAAQLACVRGMSPPQADETDPPPETQETAPMAQPQDALTKALQDAPPSATAAWLTCIAKCQEAQPTLSYVAASDQARLDNPRIYKLYVAEQRLPQPPLPPVHKRAAPAYEAIVKAADARKASQPGMTRGEALFALGQEHPHEPEYYEAYRRHHVSAAGIRDHDEVRLTKVRAGK
jgi:hypothetical protein